MIQQYRLPALFLFAALFTIASHSCDKTSSGQIDGRSGSVTSQEPKSITVNTPRGVMTLKPIDIDEVINKLIKTNDLKPATMAADHFRDSTALYIRNVACALRPHDCQRCQYLASDGNWNGANVKARPFDDNAYRGRVWKAYRSWTWDPTYIFVNQNYNFFTKPRAMEIFINRSPEPSFNVSMWTKHEHEHQRWALYSLGEGLFKATGPFLIVNQLDQSLLTLGEMDPDLMAINAVTTGKAYTLEEYLKNYGKNEQMDRKSQWIFELRL